MRNDLVTAYQRVLDLAVAILDHPQPALPTELIAHELAACLRSDVAFFFDLRDSTAHIEAITADDLAAVHTMLSVCGEHPIFHHYRDTGTTGVLDARTLLGDHTWRHSEIHPEIHTVSNALLDVTEHMTLPIPGRPGALRGFSLGRGGTGYTEAEQDLAGRIQNLLTSTDRHLTAYRHWHESINSADGHGPAGDTGLTPRELTVLSMLAQARTAHTIARRLGISPRTVHKHVQNLYRKLGTADRLSTIQRAHTLGLLRTVM